MSRLDDAIAALRKAAGTRPFVVVVDACAPEATKYAIRVEGNENAPPYLTIGLLRHAQVSIEAGCGPTEPDDDPEIPDTPE